MSREDFPVALYASRERHPLLSIATENQRLAHSYKIEWLVDGKSDPEANFCQIVRTPFRAGEGERELWLALERHLQEVEKMLWFGLPSYRVPPDGRYGLRVATCGGAIHYLGRDPLRADRITLRPLQDTILLRDRALGDDGRRPEERTHEFLSEFSLEVVAATPIRRPTSLG